MPSTPPNKVNKISPKMQMVKVARFVFFGFFCSAIVVHEYFRSPHPLHDSPDYFVYFFRQDCWVTCISPVQKGDHLTACFHLP